MVKTSLEIEGMACSMCEAHMNDAVRKAFQVKKVTSSASKHLTEIISEEELDQAKLKEAVDATGYKLISVKSEPYKKKGLFSFL